MTRYAIRRSIFLFPVLFAASLITFLAVSFLPADPAHIFLGLDATPAELERFRARHGLDQPLHVRYIDWAWGMARFDPGRSLLGGSSIGEEFMNRFPVTLLIVSFAFTFTMAFGIIFGFIAAVRQDSAPDYTVRTLSVFGLSVPDFYLLTLLMIIPAILWNYSPPAGYEGFFNDPVRALRQVVPPTLIISLGSSAVLARLMRSAMLEVLRQDYVRTARSKGLAERVVLVRHAVRNAMIPVLTVGGVLMGALLSGSIILENITGLPGLGQYTFTAVVNQDFKIIMAMTMYAATLVVVTNLVVDLLYAVVDPRIRYR